MQYQRTIRELIHEKEDYEEQLIEVGKLYRVEQAEKRRLEGEMQCVEERI